MPRNMFLMLQRQLLILWINHQFLCSGSWATRTTDSSATAVPVLNATAQPLVSSSEATLLTIRHHQQQSREPTAQMYRQLPNNNHNEEDIEDSDSEGDGGSKARWPEAAGSGRLAEAQRHEKRLSENKKSRYRIHGVHTNCTRDFFEMRLDLNSGFRGVLYAKDFPLECRARGNAQSNITLRLPTSGCGVRVEPRPVDGLMEFSVRVMLQTEQKLRQSSDILRTVRCKLPMNAMGMTVLTAGVVGAKKHQPIKQSHRNGRMRTFDDDGATSTSAADNLNSGHEMNAPSAGGGSTTTTITTTPRVRIWLELGGGDGSGGSVELGEPTKLTVRAIVPLYMGVRVVDCAALDGLGDSTQQLLDERGCPIDEQVMPALHTRFQPAEEGWSKQNEDDLVEKIFAATFPAFKFPDRERLHVSCGVQLCKGKCPNVNCRTADKLVLSSDKHLARIEVFNSLAVTAPQIEVDRLTYDRRNMSVEEYPPSVRQLHGEGTLCLSASKLAISFCTLGFIFLIAVIVAIFSLLRSRRRARGSRTGTASAGSLVAGSGSGNTLSRVQRNELSTSMFSSSSESAQSARFGSKLFMPYYPQTLPYGRVY